MYQDAYLIAPWTGRGDPIDKTQTSLAQDWEFESQPNQTNDF